VKHANAVERKVPGQHSSENSVTSKKKKFYKQDSTNCEEIATTVTVYVNKLRTGRHFIDFWLLNVADRSSLHRLLGHAMLQSTIHCSGTMILLTIGPKCFV
jgi:hypothetical protein